MTELEYTQKQTQSSIEMEMKKVVEAVNDLQEKIANGNWQNIDLTSWTDGYINRDVSKVACLLSRYRALTEALSMVRES